ncbi:polyphosphate kinase 1 [Gilvimarinus sp. F26214L]|uniref:polyphosphate kinase 1 n=1 Tax=Gilvimarinus sp. DZF01 TaxID=3461371 RepID=UPI004045FABB
MLEKSPALDLPLPSASARSGNRPITPKELSWLSFNERVLQEAANPEVPLIQRLRYLGIFSNNLDEFFRVRVADVSRLADFTREPHRKKYYQTLLREIQSETLRIQHKFDRCYRGVLRALARKHIYLINERQLTREQGQFVADFFTNRVLPELDPVLLDVRRSIPPLADGSLYLAVRIRSGEAVRYGLVEVPTDRVERFIEIPQREGCEGRVFIVLENVIRHCIGQMFRGVISIDRIDAHAFKLTLDAELELGEEINQSLINRVAASLRKRERNAKPERFVYDRDMPEDLLSFLIRKLKLGKYDSIMPGGRYHNAKDFMDFPRLGPARLEYRAMPPLPVPELSGEGENILERIRNRDILLYYPYHSFDSTLDLLKTAAVDPAVLSIHISLYRVARHSRVVDALLNARRNHKVVTAVVELQARFDEAANINWARQLEEGGVNVIFGVPGLKVHSKLILIRRKEKGTVRLYSHIGTGNFNEKTAALYTDLSLLTYDQAIGRDTQKVFDLISSHGNRRHYERLLVSPHTTRSGLQELISAETRAAHAGHPAAITLKCNNLVDSRIIELLYRASGAGVRIRIICRGMCSLVPGVPGASENIEVISIVDRLLEHARVYIFHNRGDPLYYISSADLMTRNLDYRVEVTAPIRDPALKQRIQDIVDIQWCDNRKARQVDRGLRNRIHDSGIAGSLRSQEAIHKYLRRGKVPPTVERQRRRWSSTLANCKQ